MQLLRNGEKVTDEELVKMCTDVRLLGGTIACQKYSFSSIISHFALLSTCAEYNFVDVFVLVQNSIDSNDDEALVTSA